MSFDYARYLAAKASVDDRALNRAGLATLRQLLPAPAPHILEIGAGLGTMPARLIEWGVLTRGEYTLLDVDDQLLDRARSWLTAWAAQRSVPCRVGADELQLAGLRVRFVASEVNAYLTAEPGRGVGLLIANAVLDLVDLPATLPRMLNLLAPGGSYWFTINYDGETILVPEHPHDQTIFAAYHRDMDCRVRYGSSAGHSRTGRRLFQLLRAAGAPALFAGPSDWVVHPQPDGRYPGDEQHFLACILDTIHAALLQRTPNRVLTDWITTRRAQLAAGDLIYIAHQLDFVGRVSV